MYLPDSAPLIAAEQKQAWQVISGLRRAPKRAVPKSWWLGIGALTLATLVLYVHTVGAEAALVSKQKDIQQLKKANTAQRTYLASLQNPQNIENKATQQLGMQEPKEVVFLPKPVLQAKPAVNQIPPPPAVVHEGF